MNYVIYEVAASTTYTETRDYGSHPAPLEYTEEFELPVLLGQKVPEEFPVGADWLKWGRWRKERIRQQARRRAEGSQSRALRSLRRVTPEQPFLRPARRSTSEPH